MIRRDIWIVAYPRSGNTWLARLLGDLFASPVTGIYSAHPLAEEGLDRPGPFTVRQLHLRPSYDDNHTCLVPNAWTLAVKHWQLGDLLVTILRDPRDIAVSAWKYWDIPSLAEAVKCMGEGVHPLGMIGPWQSYVSAWRKAPVQAVTARYETLVRNPLDALKGILIGLHIEVPDDERIWETIDRQAIDARRKEIASAPGDKYMYGSTIQLKHLRRGVAGDWKNWFTMKEGKLAEEYFGSLMRQLGYTTDETWWEGLKE